MLSAKLRQSQRPPAATLALGADQEAGGRAQRRVQGLTTMTTVRPSHSTGSRWSTRGGSAWPAVDSGYRGDTAASAERQARRAAVRDLWRHLVGQGSRGAQESPGSAGPVGIPL